MQAAERQAAPCSGTWGRAAPSLAQGAPESSSWPEKQLLSLLKMPPTQTEKLCSGENCIPAGQWAVSKTCSQIRESGTWQWSVPVTCVLLWLRSRRFWPEDTNPVLTEERFALMISTVPLFSQSPGSHPGFNKRLPVHLCSLLRTIHQRFYKYQGLSHLEVFARLCCTNILSPGCVANPSQSRLERKHCSCAEAQLPVWDGIRGIDFFLRKTKIFMFQPGRGTLYLYYLHSILQLFNHSYQIRPRSSVGARVWFFVWKTGAGQWGSDPWFHPGHSLSVLWEIPSPCWTRASETHPWAFPGAGTCLQSRGSPVHFRSPVPLLNEARVFWRQRRPLNSSVQLFTKFFEIFAYRHEREMWLSEKSHLGGTMNSVFKVKCHWSFQQRLSQPAQQFIPYSRNCQGRIGDNVTKCAVQFASVLFIF